jgi:hypothetical protein
VLEPERAKAPVLGKQADADCCLSQSEKVLAKSPSVQIPTERLEFKQRPLGREAPSKPLFTGRSLGSLVQRRSVLWAQPNTWQLMGSMPVGDSETRGVAANALWTCLQGQVCAEPARQESKLKLE